MTTDLDHTSSSTSSSDPSGSTDVEEIESISSSSNNVNSEILVKILNCGFEGTFTKNCSRS